MYMYDACACDQRILYVRLTRIRSGLLENLLAPTHGVQAVALRALTTCTQLLQEPNVVHQRDVTDKGPTITNEETLAGAFSSIELLPSPTVSCYCLTALARSLQLRQQHPVGALDVGYHVLLLL